MKILYVLQQSIYNNDGQWLSADSNINMMVGMMHEIKKHRPDWHFYVLIAPIQQFADIRDYRRIYSEDNCTFIPYSFPVNAFVNRYAFNPEKFGDVINEIKPDIVWNNICELTRNMKTVARQLKCNPKFITSNYWMDCPFIGEEKVDKDISYFWRQFDGFECSDLATFTCKSTKRAFFQNAQFVIRKSILSELEKKSAIFDFGYSVKEINAKLGYIAHKLTDKPRIGFLNRLSGINYTHHKEFIDAVNSVKEDFDVFFANPSMKFDPNELRDSISEHKVVTPEMVLSREDYIRMLWQMDISVHLYTIERYGGCAVREAIEARNVIIAPKVHEYARILGDDYPFYVKDDLSDLSDVLLRSILFVKENNRNKAQALSDGIIERNRQSSFEVVAHTVVNAIESLK